MLLEGGVSISSALTDFTSVLTTTINTIQGNSVLMTMFVGGLMVVAARVFRKLKKAVY